MKTKLLVAACASALNLTEQRLVIIPEGNFKGIDGRPIEADSWFLTSERGQKIVAALNSRKIDMVVDYEHGTLSSKETGQPAPAAGWLKEFTYVEGVGICSSDFKWTDKAQSFIDAEEYKYLSPVFSYTTTGEVTGLLCVALTNTPNLDELPALLAAAAQDLFAQNNQQDESSTMNEELLERLRWMLNLPVSATAEEIIAELAKLQSQISEKTGVAVAANSKNLFDALAAIDQIKIAANSQQKPDLSKYVPIGVVTSLQNEIATLKGAAQTNEIETLIVAACADGRLLGEGMKDWATNLGESNPQALKEFLDKAPKIPALNGKQTETIAANSQQKPNQHTAEDLAVAAMFGHSLDN
ncbi:phage protease [Acinetobacter modestus]|uniref:phage protease n=1 Tax=Acinetobacter modestus TaxID=1776740 RepID=UPI00301B1E73